MEDGCHPQEAVLSARRLLSPPPEVVELHSAPPSPIRLRKKKGQFPSSEDLEVKKIFAPLPRKGMVGPPQGVRKTDEKVLVPSAQNAVVGSSSVSPSNVLPSNVIKGRNLKNGTAEKAFLPPVKITVGGKKCTSPPKSPSPKTINVEKSKGSSDPVLDLKKVPNERSGPSDKEIVQRALDSTIWFRRVSKIDPLRYIEAVGNVIGDNNIIAANIDHNLKIEIVVKNPSQANRLIMEGVKIGDTWLQAYRHSDRPQKITISHVPQYVPNTSIIEALKPFGTCSIKDIETPLTPFHRPTLLHVESFRRTVWLRVNREDEKELPETLKVEFGERIFTVSVSGGPPRCFKCNTVGHVRRTCPLLRLSQGDGRELTMAQVVSANNRPSAPLPNRPQTKHTWGIPKGTTVSNIDASGQGVNTMKSKTDFTKSLVNNPPPDTPKLPKTAETANKMQSQQSKKPLALSKPVVGAGSAVPTSVMGKGPKTTGASPRAPVNKEKSPSKSKVETKAPEQLPPDCISKVCEQYSLMTQEADLLTCTHAMARYGMSPDESTGFFELSEFYFENKEYLAINGCLPPEIKLSHVNVEMARNILKKGNKFILANPRYDNLPYFVDFLGNAIKEEMEFQVVTRKGKKRGVSAIHSSSPQESETEDKSRTPVRPKKNTTPNPTPKRTRVKTVAIHGRRIRK